VTAHELLAAARAAGLRLEARPGDVLHVAPRHRLTPDLREALRAQKAAVLDAIRELQARTLAGVDWSRVSLIALDRVLEVAVPWSDVALIVAPGCRIARELREREPRPGRVWCACEALDLLLSRATPEDARRIADARLTFDGEAIRVVPERQGQGR
jgi:hypothetical protein